ncbi:TRAF family member-associated NF-kappa-B activator isoform X1 [Pygocentrus nattereri]|uniref:TRAF family member-associated NFKB activator n=1 Tax=Pygocentrus nattereri TaxID=42514 RepID=A0A3B4EGB0_PYGNA|nr:TRAF family member-associated NF-kappa-B activator isoform X1 [Pygocentrus nattereri]
MTADSDVIEGHGMERNISDQLNKAYEAYRNVLIEKDNAKKELQQKTEQFERYTQQLKRKIEDQEQLISELKAQLSSAVKYHSGEVKCCEAADRKQETERLSPSNQWSGNPTTSHRTNHVLEAMECAQTIPRTVPGISGMKTEDVLDALQEIQGTFQRIQTLTRRQKDHLKRIHKGNDTANEQEFSMPIQCTDDTSEQAEVSFTSSSRSEVNDRLTSSSLASRGINPDDADFMYDVIFPPSTDTEYEFLLSGPDESIPLSLHRKDPVETFSVMEESISPFLSSSPSHLPAVSASHEAVRGPQQLVWSPDLSSMASEESSMEPATTASPSQCAFCKAIVPVDLIYSHLNSHFQGD